jgi:hypothetical protein
MRDEMDDLLENVGLDVDVILSCAGRAPVLRPEP